MNNPIARGVLFTIVLCSLIFALAPPASASVVDDAVAALESGTSTGANSGFSESGIAVVEVEVNANSLFTPPQLAQQIFAKLDGEYKTVIVVNTDATSNIAYGVVPGESSAAILPILNLNGGGKGVAWLNLNEDAIIAAVTETGASTEADLPHSDSISASNFDLMGLVIPGVLILGAVAAAIWLVIKLKSRRKVQPVRTKAVKREEMRQAMEELGRLAKAHADKHYPTYKVMNSILAHLNELFSRLERKGVENQKNLAEVEYSSTIQKLNDALGNDYYLDIAGNGTLWDRSPERLEEVLAAAQAVDSQLLYNIRQVNSSKDLDFRVALESILRSVEQPNVGDMLRTPQS